MIFLSIVFLHNKVTSDTQKSTPSPLFEGKFHIDRVLLSQKDSYFNNSSLYFYLPRTMHNG